MDLSTNLKTCRTCKKAYPLNEFYKHSRSEDGLHPSCKWCCKVSRALESVRKRDRKSKLSVRQRVRAMQLGIQYDIKITLTGIFKRDHGICYLCNKWVAPRDASMDHVTALINGGTHTFDNVRLTHLKCNLRKGSKHHAI